MAVGADNSVNDDVNAPFFEPMTTTTTPSPPQPPDRGAIHFPLQPGERVLTICRKHWLFLYPRLVLYLVLAVAPLALLALALSKAGGFHGTGKQIFEIVAEINNQGTAVLLVEQFVHMALGGTDRAYVLEQGRITLSGTGPALLDDPHVQKAYLGA